MENQPPFHEQVREARRSQRLNQTALAERIGCSQSAISYFENGNTGVLSEELIDKLAKSLGLERRGEEPDPFEEFNSEKPGVLAFCGEPDCPAAWHDVVARRHVIYPAFFEMTAGPDLPGCPFCSTLLETHCLQCKTPLVRNSGFCPGCKTPLVVSAVNPADLEEFVERMQRRHDRHFAARGKIETIPALRFLARMKR